VNPTAAHEATGVLGWLAATPLSNAMRTGLWTYPIVEIVHIFGFVVLVGSVVMFDLRVLGLSKNLSVQAVARHLLPWSIAALLLVVPAGLMMFSAHPDDFATNNVFLLKLGLIGIAGINAAMFHLGVYSSVPEWDTGVAAPGAAKFQAVLSIGLWTSVICCGRLLAYT
jgi:hypothetical protein